MMGQTYDTTPPTLVSITQTESSLTTASTVDYTVRSSEPVTGVNASDFSLATTGLAGASVASVTPITGSSGTQYAVAVDTGSGDGTITLDLTGIAITDLAGNGYSGGAFQPQTMYATGSAPRSVAIGDLNGDGRPDLVAANYGSDAVAALLRSGGGGIHPRN